jgi:DNA polymerase elongation subunit (family B)
MKAFRLFTFNVFDESKNQILKDDSSISSDDGSTNSSTKKAVTPQDTNFIIQSFGINECGETCSIIITDYQPFFYIMVGQLWEQEQADELLRHLRRTVGFYHKQFLLRAELVEYNKLYGFTAGKKNKFVKLIFQNTSSMNRTKQLWYKQTATKRSLQPLKFLNTMLELYESNLPPILRYFHIHNISPSGWVKFRLNDVIQVTDDTEKLSSCKYEFRMRANQLEPMPEKETIVPYKICSFDIEASSSHGDFPVPIKSYKRLATNMIDVFIKYNKSKALANDKANDMIRKMLLTAFQFYHLEDIDAVYPKNPDMVTKAIIQKLTEEFLTMSSLLSNKNITTIASMFESIHCEENHYEHGESDGEGECEVEEDNVVLKKIQPRKQMQQSSPTTTVLDIFQSDKLSRDDKIQKINEILTDIFPPLEGDKVTFIGSTFLRYGETEPYLNHCLVLSSCDPVSNAEIVTRETECELLEDWANLIQKEDPDIIIGYNIFGFDYEFMFRRAQENSCESKFLQLSRKQGEVCVKIDRQTNEQSLENTKIVLATGEYDLRYPSINGRLQIDMYAYFRRDFNLSSYKLDDVAGQFIADDIKHILYDSEKQQTLLYTNNISGLHIDDYIHIELCGFTSDYYDDGKKFIVLDILRNIQYEGKHFNVICIGGCEDFGGSKSIKWCMAKDDVSPQDIFRLTNGSTADRAKVAKYCIQDCNMVHHLFQKIDVLTGYIEMSRICSVPISFLVFRGQGIKLTSYVAKKCREKDTLMPDLDKGEFTDDGYEGAIVLPPKCAIYMDNPVACVDYASLYPSSMISQNFSHDSKVWAKEYNLSNKLISESGEKSANGKSYLYDNLPDYEYIDIEFDTFKYLKDPKKPSSKAVKTKVGKRVVRWAQLPNSQRSIMPSILTELLKARSDTRKQIKTVSDPFMQNILDKRQLGYKVTANSLYGQCGAKTSTFYEKDVAASTTATGRMMIMYAKTMIEEVYGNMEYNTQCHGPVLTKAEYVYGDSVASYTPIMLRITHYDSNHYPSTTYHVCNIEEIPYKILNDKSSQDIWKKCNEPGRQSKEFCDFNDPKCLVEVWSDNGWTRLKRVIRHELSSHKRMIRVATSTGIVDVTDDHSLLRQDGTEVSPNDLCIGDELLHYPLPEYVKKMSAKVEATCNSIDLGNTKRMQFSTQLYAMQWYWQLSRCGYLVEIDYEYSLIDKDASSAFGYNYILRIVDEISTPNKVRSMVEIPYFEYVYDLTTENHHFAAGIGNMIVHNTDSVFFTFNLQDKDTGAPIRGKKALEMTIEIAQDAAHLCSHYLKHPMELSYEKTLMPFILLSKKRYVGMLYETDPNKGKLKYMGLSLKRRDSCDYLKDVYGGILTILMDTSGSCNRVNDAVAFLDSAIRELIEGKVGMDKLTITKALRGYYKNPDQMAHNVLSQRIGQRDPGNKPKPGDRIKFVHITSKNKKALQGEKIETPQFITENKLSIDYEFYITNQVMKPLQQLFGLALDQIWKTKTQCDKHKVELERLQKEFPDIEIYMKKREKLCSQKVKALLFDKYLIEIENKRNGQRVIQFY